MVDLSYLKNLSQGYSKNEILDDLMIAYGDDVWNFAYSLTGRPDVADDIRQDVFVKAYTKLDAYRGESSAKTWLLSITRNAVIDRQRLSFFRKVSLFDYFSERGIHPSAEKEFFEKQEISEAWKSVVRLPVKLREVIVLYAYHQLSIAEIAALLKLTETAVKVRLHRARKKVNEWFDESEGD